MTAINRFAGSPSLSLPAPLHTDTALEELLANMPGLDFWIAPRDRLFRKLGTNLTLLDGANGVPIGFTAAGSIALGDRNGNPVLNMSGSFVGGTTDYLMPDSPEWSIFAVVNLLASRTVIGGIPANYVANDRVVRLGVGGGSVAVLYTGTSSARIQGTSNIANAWHLIGVTFSMSRGLRMYVDGILEATQAGDTTPLTDRRIQPFRHSSGSWAQGDVGHVLIMDRDYSTVEMSSYRTALFAALIEAYGVV